MLSMDQTNQGVVMHVLSGQSGQLSPMAIFITVMHNEIFSNQTHTLSMIKSFWFDKYLNSGVNLLCFDEIQNFFILY